MMTIKSTYSLDVETARALDEMARRWNVSKSEALRRAIRAAAETLPPEGERAVEALDRLQRSLALDAQAGDAWVDEVKSERRSLGDHRDRPERT